jgi:hypothetical protein
MKRIAMMAAACTLTIGGAQAASNGTLGSTSTATQTISATISDVDVVPQVRISGVEDVIFGTLIPGRFASAFTNYCFFHTSPSFSLTISQSEVSTPGFALLGPLDARIPLRFSLNGLDVNGNFISFEPQNGVSRTGLRGNRNSENCSSGSSNSGDFSLQPLDDQAPGEYSGTLTFVLAVE